MQLNRLLRLTHGGAMAQAVRRWLLIVEAQVRSRVSPCGVCGGQSGTGTGFSPVIRFFLSVSLHRGSLLYFICGLNNRPVRGRSSET
jgi:hypothetical protein